MTPDQQEAFWPIYREYARDIAKVYDQKFEIIRIFHSEFDMMKPERARQLLENSWSAQQEVIAIKKRYFNEFTRVLGEVIATRFYQVDRRLDLVTDLQIMHELPLVQDPGKLDAEEAKYMSV